MSVPLKGCYFAPTNKNLRYQMKKNLFFYLFAVLCTVSLFTSCSDDDEPTVTVPGNVDVAGDYKGALDVTLKMETGDVPAGSVPAQLVSVTNAGENTVDLKISNFSFSGMSLGDIELNGCQLADAGNGKYTFTATSSMDVTGLLSAGIKANGVFEDKTLTLDLDIDDVKLMGSPVPYTVKVTYSGTKLSGTESSEAKILSFVFDKEVAAVDSLVVGDVVINEESKTITFMVADTAKAEYLTALVPTIEVSDGATVTPASGVAQDFSNGKTVTYTVTAAGGNVAEYKASIVGKTAFYDFEDWKTVEVKSEFDGSVQWTYQLPVAGAWSGADAALQLIPVMVPTFDATQRSLLPTDEAYSGSKAAKVVTLDTEGAPSFMPGVFPSVPKVTSGSLFLGDFEVDAQKTLRSTRFGVPYSAKPIVVRGYYKYIPGEVYYRCDDPEKSNEAVKDASLKDECAISAVLYEVSSYETTEDHDKDERLDGTNIYTSDKIVAMAVWESGATDEYAPFELNLEYKQEFDATKLYRFAIICSSSKNGTTFSGAPGSTLYIDDIEVVAE
mgnify:FL=1